MMTSKNAIALVSSAWILGGTLAGGLVLGPAVHAAPTTSATSAACEEDQPCWDCRTMGNLECGPGNAQGVPAGDYGEIDSMALEYR